jgi:predicted HAD superfamily hydrolase
MENVYSIQNEGSNLTLQCSDNIELKEKVASAEVVSFDFFDTLFVRDLLNPEDVFDIMGKIFEIEDFRTQRRSAQVEAFKRMHHDGLKEINLVGIYDCFDACPVSPKELMETEIEVELLLTHPNPELTDLFKSVVECGKQVVLTSDTYLPESFFKDIFRLYAIKPVPMYISAERNATKRDYGELFDIIVNETDCSPRQLLHIGDNYHSDVLQADAKGLTTYHYKAYRSPPIPNRVTPETSLARGLLRKHMGQIPSDTPKELGFLYGGPAMVGFLDWITAQARRDAVDHILFLSRDGYFLNSLANLRKGRSLPSYHYFLGSRIVFTLAAMTEDNFSQFLPFLLSGAEGLSAYELLERIDVPSPSDAVMNDLKLGPEIRYTEDKYDQFQEFLYAYRSEILKVCRRNRRSLFMYLRNLEIPEGSRVAFVDVGWNGTSQDAFELAIQDFYDLEVFGYYFCLADTRERRRIGQKRRMSSFLAEPFVPKDTIRRIYDNRVGVELFFSAPHQSVIGYDILSNREVSTIHDGRNGYSRDIESFYLELMKGMELFSESYENLRDRLRISTDPYDLASLLVDFIIKEDWTAQDGISSLKNFDGWSFTHNVDVSLAQYLP